MPFFSNDSNPPASSNESKVVAAIVTLCAAAVRVCDAIAALAGETMRRDEAARESGGRASKP